MRCICVQINLLPSTMAALDDIKGWEVADNMLCYILLPNVISPKTHSVLREHSLSIINISDDVCTLLAGNTPMNLRRAIKTGALQRPSDAHQDVWKEVCDRARIIEESRAQTAFQALQYVVALALYGRGEQKV